MYVNEMTELMNICMIYDNHGNYCYRTEERKIGRELRSPVDM